MNGFPSFPETPYDPLKDQVLEVVDRFSTELSMNVYFSDDQLEDCGCKVLNLLRGVQIMAQGGDYDDIVEEVLFFQVGAYAGDNGNGGSYGLMVAGTNGIMTDIMLGDDLQGTDDELLLMVELVLNQLFMMAMEAQKVLEYRLEEKEKCPPALDIVFYREIQMRKKLKNLLLGWSGKSMGVDFCENEKDQLLRLSTYVFQRLRIQNSDDEVMFLKINEASLGVIYFVRRFLTSILTNLRYEETFRERGSKSQVRAYFRVHEDLFEESSYQIQAISEEGEVVQDGSFYYNEGFAALIPYYINLLLADLRKLDLFHRL